MSESPSADEFDQFLQESVNKESRNLEYELAYEEMESRISAVLMSRGYVSLTDDKDYYDSELAEYLEAIRGMTQEDGTGYTTDEAEKLAKRTLRRREENELYLLAILRINLLSSMVRSDTPEVAAAKKRKLFAAEWVSERISLNELFFHVFNELLPGPTIDMDDPEMVPFLVSEMAKSAAKADGDNEFMQNIEAALSYAGVNLLQRHDVLKRYYWSAMTIRLAGYQQSANPYAAEESMLESARNQTIEPEIAQKIAEFYIRNPPPRGGD